MNKNLLFAAILATAFGNMASWTQTQSKTESKSKFVEITWFLEQGKQPRNWQQCCKKILSLLWQLKECNPEKIEILIEARSLLNGSLISSKSYLEKDDLDNLNLAEFNSINPELENPERIKSIGLEITIACDSKTLEKIYNCIISFDKNISTIKFEKDQNIIIRISNKFPFAIVEEKKK